MALPAPAADSAVLVTGASAGIGAALARGLAARGHGLVLVARREDRLRELADELAAAHGVQVDVRACDLVDADARARLVSELQAGDREIVGLVNNAGDGTFGRFWEQDPAVERDEVALNATALHDLMLAFLPRMVERGEGAILNVGSVAGEQPLPNNATYAATKAFVNSLSEAVNTELAGSGVSCTLLQAGPVLTEFADAAGVGRFQGAGGSLLWADAADVAEGAIAGMKRGRRVVSPKASHSIAAQAGRMTPRFALLRVIDRLTRDRL